MKSCSNKINDTVWLLVDRQMSNNVSDRLSSHVIICIRLSVYRDVNNSIHVPIKEILWNQ